jgi:hypothetical protein
MKEILIDGSLGAIVGLLIGGSTVILKIPRR